MTEIVVGIQQLVSFSLLQQRLIYSHAVCRDAALMLQAALVIGSGIPGLVVRLPDDEFSPEGWMHGPQPARDTHCHEAVAFLDTALRAKGGPAYRRDWYKTFAASLDSKALLRPSLSATRVIWEIHAETDAAVHTELDQWHSHLGLPLEEDEAARVFGINPLTPDAARGDIAHLRSDGTPRPNGPFRQTPPGVVLPAASFRYRSNTAYTVPEVLWLLLQHPTGVTASRVSGCLLEHDFVKAVQDIAGHGVLGMRILERLVHAPPFYVSYRGLVGEFEARVTVGRIVKILADANIPLSRGLTLLALSDDEKETRLLGIQMIAKARKTTHLTDSPTKTRLVPCGLPVNHSPDASPRRPS